jgi:hypothetical protein
VAPKQPRVPVPFPDAERRLRSLCKDIPPRGHVTVNSDDIYSVLDELRALRARNAALFREMGRPLPGFGDD